MLPNVSSSNSQDFSAGTPASTTDHPPKTKRRSSCGAVRPVAEHPGLLPPALTLSVTSRPASRSTPKSRSSRSSCAAPRCSCASTSARAAACGRRGLWSRVEGRNRDNDWNVDWSERNWRKWEYGVFDAGTCPYPGCTWMMILSES